MDGWRGGRLLVFCMKYAIVILIVMHIDLLIICVYMCIYSVSNTLCTLCIILITLLYYIGFNMITWDE